MASYRPDIDGLRAVAVIAVLVFHAFPETGVAGFVGVDVFFVISGFLITGIIHRELVAGTFTLRHFYARRIRRIFPALILVLAFSFALAWKFLLPPEMVSFGWNLLGGAGFVSNFVLWREAGYFDAASHAKPLLHLWSLGIEEQFYIAFPILLMGAFRLRIGLLSVALVLLVGSFSLNIAWVSSDPIGTFYNPATRAWELMVGAVLALTTRQITTRSVAEVASVLGVALIGGALYFLTKKTAFPGWAALLPTVGAALILASERSTLNRFILGSLPFRWIGLISYPLYLWHWPLLSFAHILNPEGTDWTTRAGLVGISVVLSVLTYWLVERPFRLPGLATAKVASLATIMMAIAVSGGMVIKGDGIEARLPETVRDVTAAKPDIEREWRYERCFLGAASVYAAECVDADRKRKLVFLWGDSMAASLYPGLRSWADREGFSLGQFAAGGCPPLVFYVAELTRCGPLNLQVLEAVDRHKPDIVVLFAFWDPTVTKWYDFKWLENTAAELRKRGVSNILVLGPVPEWQGGLPQAVFSYFMQHRLLVARYSTFRLKTEAYDTQLQQAAAAAGVNYVSARELVCNESGCLTRLGDAARDLTTWDNAHLTLKGARNLVDLASKSFR